MAKDSKAKGKTPTPARAASSDRRLIEEWLPIAALSEESIRERRSMTALPPTYYLHVWWARRPLVASRAAILGSLLPATADQSRFLYALGIHGDPVAAREAIDNAIRTGERVANPYTYDRAFQYTPSDNDQAWFREEINGVKTVLDPTAGGGSIPFEAVRLGLPTIGNDLNPVAWLILKATVEFPFRFGHQVLDRFNELSAVWLSSMKNKMSGFFPTNPDLKWPDFDSIPKTKGERPAVNTVFGQHDATYLWARTISCPYCGGLVPLSPNWRLNGSGTGVKLIPQIGQGSKRYYQFQIVDNLQEHSEGTVDGGDGKCPFPDCGRVIDGDEIKRQAQAGQMGEQLYAVVFREKKITGYTAQGKPKIKMLRGFRAPQPEDEVSTMVRSALDERMPAWLARGVIPDEEIVEGLKTQEPLRYGMRLWRDLFSPRQRLGHGMSVEVFRQLVDKCGGVGSLSELDTAALTYVALALDKLLNYNACMARWHSNREVIAGVFDRHDYAFLWSYAEMAPAITGLGYEWAIEQTGKALEELIELSGHPPRIGKRGKLEHNGVLYSEAGR